MTSALSRAGGHDGVVLAQAYDRAQAAWGDKRRAFVTGEIPRRGRAGVPRCWMTTLAAQAHSLFWTTRLRTVRKVAATAPK